MNLPQKVIAVFLTPVILLIQYILTFVMSSLTLIGSYFLPQKFIDTTLKLWGRSIFIVMGKRIQIAGMDHLDKDKKYLLLVNHASVYDIPAIMTTFPSVAWLGREHLTKIPVFGHALKRSHYVAIPRNPGKNIRNILNDAICNAQSKIVAMFPEGTRTTSGDLGTFKRGFIHILNNSDLDVLPVTLNGMFCLRPKIRFLINPFCSVNMVIHKPVSRNELVHRPYKEVLEEIKETIASQYKN